MATVFYLFVCCLLCVRKQQFFYSVFSALLPCNPFKKCRFLIQILSHSKKIIYSVYLFLKQLSNKPDLTADFFKNAQVVTAEACGVGYLTVRRICAEGKNSVNLETPGVDPTFVSPHKRYKRAKPVSVLDDFDSDVVRRTV